MQFVEDFVLETETHGVWFVCGSNLTVSLRKSCQVSAILFSDTKLQLSVLVVNDPRFGVETLVGSTCHFLIFSNPEKDTFSHGTWSSPQLVSPIQ